MKEIKNDLHKPVSQCFSEVHTVVEISDTIQEALKKVRKQKISEKIIYFYAVDKKGKLVGVVPTRDLLLSTPDTLIKDILQYSVIRLHSEQTLQEALEIFDRHRLLALPVVDSEGVLKGALDIEFYMEESFDVADSRHRRDMFQLLGMTIEEGKKVSILKRYRFRMPWLFCNMVSGFICAIIARVNEKVLDTYLLLAMFIPLVLTLSESVSMQSMTQSMQFFRRPRVSSHYIFLRVFHEWKIVGLIAFSCALIVFFVSLLWRDGFLASFTIGFGIFLATSISAFFGTLFPVFIHKTNLDPKVASGPVVLMFADTLTTLLYLSIASWWLL